MSKLAIKVENLSKQYRLGEVGTGTLSHDLNRWWHKVRGKEDPYLQVGEVNKRDTIGNSEYAWALKDINFEVKKGEILGIIGKNGAGKSTLLKILSKVTGPSQGRIRAKGRVASLLEVGTGFHPELTGRDNIFLNGTILGMSRKEVAKKLDEIVDFAGVERYLDTPVKRYSSGMQVRLGFAVAAHLEPEILIVDEVLAVGDAEFQKKCIGKMGEISEGEGRTILLVSHNMASIESLCNRCALLEDGELKQLGLTSNVVNNYRKNGAIIPKTSLKERTDRQGNGVFKFESISFNRGKPVLSGEPILITLNYQTKKILLKNVHVILIISNKYGERLMIVSNKFQKKKLELLKKEGQIEINIPRNNFLPNSYKISLWCAIENQLADYVVGATNLHIENSTIFDARTSFEEINHGYFYPEISEWSVQ